MLRISLWVQPLGSLSSCAKLKFDKIIRFEVNSNLSNWTKEKMATSMTVHNLPVQVGMVNSNKANSKFHFIRSFYEMFSYHFM